VIRRRNSDRGGETARAACAVSGSISPTFRQGSLSACPQAAWRQICHKFFMAIEFTAQETDEAIHSLKKYFVTELDVDLSDLRARLLLDYLLKEIAPLAYNRGVHDAEEFFRKRLEDLPATCFEPALTYWQAKKKKK
jgi:uncharacterized protein (DUF2164 family)